MNFKKILALVLAVAMVLTAVGCTGNNTSSAPESKAPESSAVESVAESSAEESQPEEVVDPAVEYPSFNVGEITTNIAPAGGGEVNYNAYKGVAGKDYTDEKVYTHNEYMSGNQNMNWNPLQWETNSDSYILDYIQSVFYDFVLNEDLDGWAIIPEMAAELPVDVTAEYVGKFGVAEGDTAKAWRIKLNENITWQNGEAITADDFIYSYQQLLDPAQKNRRADSLYAGDFRIAGAKEYFYAGQTSYTDTEGSVALADLTAGEDGQYVDSNGNKYYIGFAFPLAQTGGDTLKDYIDAYGDTYFDLENVEALTALMDDNGLIPLTDENLALFAPVTTKNPAWNETEADLPNYFVVAESFEEGNWDNVGVVKVDDYTIDFITALPTENPNYYVPYNLSVYLVYKPMYEELKTFTDGAFTTTYGTTVETTMGFGPYKLDYFELDKQITFTRNENWYGYSDGKHEGMYQTDIISCAVIEAQATALLAFEKGELDEVNLVAQDMAKYASSQYIRYTPQSYTTKLTFNSDETALAARGTQILGNLNFRKAFSLAIDRSTFAASYTAAGSAGYGMLNYMYVYDPFTGASYRDSDVAKAVLCDVYGITYGPDGDYDDIDEAYDAITGYDLEQAKELMELAYKQCKADGTYNDQNVEITLSVYSSDDTYVQMFNFLNDALKSACEGTGFEGKVSLKMVADADYYETMYSGNTDIIFSTWGGAAYSPFTLLYECYCDAADGSGNQMEYGFDSTKVEVTINVDGKDMTYSLQDWARWMDNQVDVPMVETEGMQPFASYDAATRCAVFAKCEYVYLSNFVNTPMYYRNVGSLVSQKGDYAVDTYLDLVGFGGIRYFTYEYDDEAWTAQMGNLVY
ncbi:MAG: hypothetical protein IJM90_05590 [Firmicutes bacterium]|nr:hypothetical protein [Bacillota bacterium]